MIFHALDGQIFLALGNAEKLKKLLKLLSRNSKWGSWVRMGGCRTAGFQDEKRDHFLKSLFKKGVVNGEPRAARALSSKFCAQTTLTCHLPAAGANFF